MKSFLVAILALTALANAEIAEPSTGSTVSFTLFATDLTGCDWFTACDSFVKIYCSSRDYDWRECGKTKVISNDNFPVYPEVFTFEHVPSNSERWRFDVLDDKLIGNSLIGSATVIVDDFVQAIVKPIRFDLQNRGYLNIMDVKRN